MLQAGLSLVVALLLVTAGGTIPASATDSEPRIRSVYPDTVKTGDAGEHVVIDPAGVPGLTVSDGETTVPVPPHERPVALATRPTAARNRTEHPVVEVAGLALANGGERLRLRRDGQLLDTLEYEHAPTAERLTDDGWRPYGYTPRSVDRYGATNATTFLLPDSPAVPLRTLRRADDRLLLAGYTLSSERVVDAVLGAADRGVRVRVLVDGSPVGGLSRQSAAALDRLTRSGVEVKLVDGPRARFAYHHAKYAVVDDSAFVATENWVPGGVGGRDNRGWGVVVRSAAVADGLAALFTRDIDAHDAHPWRAIRKAAELQDDPSAEGAYPTRVGPSTVRAEEVRLLTAPGNAGDAVVSLLDGADRRVRVVQPSVGGAEGRFVRACLRAARRGVDVQLLLAGAWYTAEENEQVAEQLRAVAADEELPLAVRLAEPNGRYGSVHAKGVIVDDTAVVGSLNWNRHSAKENREVAVALHGSEVAEYYRRAFRRDWRGGPRSPPAGLAFAALVVLGVAVAVLRAVVGFDQPP